MRGELRIIYRAQEWPFGRFAQIYAVLLSEFVRQPRLRSRARARSDNKTREIPDRPMFNSDWLASTDAEDLLAGQIRCHAATEKQERLECG